MCYSVRGDLLGAFASVLSKLEGAKARGDRGNKVLDSVLVETHGGSRAHRADAAAGTVFSCDRFSSGGTVHHDTLSLPRMEQSRSCRTLFDFSSEQATKIYPEEAFLSYRPPLFPPSPYIVSLVGFREKYFRAFFPGEG